VLAVTLVPVAARAQEPSASPGAPASAPAWSGSASLAAYFIPDDSDYVQPAILADRGWLHLEARYNYEARKTASFWGGVNVETGGKHVTLALTPMFGVVTGDTDGVAPGLRLSLSTWKLELYAESEWVFDSGDETDSFFYTWSEFTFHPIDWLRFGTVAQRTRAYQTDRYIQRGVLAGVMWKKASLTGHVFEPFSSQKTVVVSVGIEF
jgi:hypothetical protein